MLLEVPASPRYLAQARVLAASVAADLDLSVEEIEQLRIAVDELMAMLIEAVDGRGQVRLTYSPDGDRLEICGETTEPCKEIVLDDLTRHILATVVDEHEIVEGRFSMTKRRVSA